MLTLSTNALFAHNHTPTEPQADNTILDESTQTKRYKKRHDRSQTWIIGAGAGAQTYFADHNRQQSFTKNTTLFTQAFIGYWLDNEFALRLHGQGLGLKGLTQNNSYTTGIVADKSKWLKFQEFNYYAIHLDAMYNLSPFIDANWDLNSYRCVPYLGFGMARNTSEPSLNSFSTSVGIYNTFDIAPKIDLFMDLRGVLVSDKFDGEVGENKGEGVLSLSLGISFKIR